MPRGLLDRAMWRAIGAGESIAVRGCRVVWCSVSGIASPVARAGGVRVGKGKGYNRVRAANAIQLL